MNSKHATSQRNAPHLTQRSTFVAHQMPAKPVLKQAAGHAMPWKALRAGLVNCGVALSGLLGIGGVSAPVMAQSGPVFVCEPGTVYSIRNGTRHIDRVNVPSGASEIIGTLPSPGFNANWNGMGIQAEGDSLFAVQHGGSNSGRVLQYNVATGQSEFSPPPSGQHLNGYQSSFVTGAVNPANGWFYFTAPNRVIGSQRVGRHALFAYNPAWGTTGRPVRVGYFDASGNNGDIAFDAMGNLYALLGNIDWDGTALYRINGPMPQPTSSNVGPSNSNLNAVRLTNYFTSSQNYAGIAFDNGLLVLQVGSSSGNGVSTYQRVNPATGQFVGGSFSGIGGVDLASCQNPNTIRLQKNLPDGRIAPADQFTLSITGGGITGGNTATTSGSASGLQSAEAGPVIAQSGIQYTVSESGPNLGNYTSSLTCVNESSGQPIAVNVNAAGTSGTLTLPNTSGGGVNVLCTFTNAVPSVDLGIEKTVTPTAAQVGDVLTYTLTVTNAGPATAVNAILTDQLPAEGLDCSAAVPVCTSSGGAVCPSGAIDLGDLTGTGITLPSIPMSGEIIVTLQCAVTEVGP